MKKQIVPAVVMTVLCMFLFSGVYTLFVWAAAQAAPGAGKGVRLTCNGKIIGYKNVGQSFTEDRYFNSRPSATNYNAAGSAGSNKGPSNPGYLKSVSDRIDTFLAHNPGVSRKEIPVELVTASGSGLDPQLSPEAALVQVKRIASVRGIPENELKALVQKHTSRPFPGPACVNVLVLNAALDDRRQ